MSSNRKVRESTKLVTDLIMKLSGPRDMTSEEAIDFFASVIEDLEPRIEALRAEVNKG
jgi:hypothetical protein